MNMRAHQQIIDLAESVEEQWRQKAPGLPLIDIHWQLWDIECIAHYLRRSKDRARLLVKEDGFPKPIRLPGATNAHPLYKAREIIAWAESFST
jgi:hypothetical protein